MQGIAIDFSWAQFPDYRVEEEPPAQSGMLVGMGPALIGQGNPLVTRPLEQFPELYLRLAEAELTLAGHKAFARKYGLLVEGRRELTRSWEDKAVGMQDLVEKVRDKWAWDILDGTYLHYEMPRSFHFRFRPIIGTDEIKLSIVPENLWTALTLQCVSNCTSGARVRACKACGALFEIGGASGRRSHAEFCSPKCRFGFSYRNRKRGKK